MNGNLAQITNPVMQNILRGGKDTGGSAVGSLVGSLLGLFVIISFVIAFVYLVLGGFEWTTSGGDKAKLQSARDRITNSLIGLIVVSASWAIMSLVGDFLGITFPNFTIPTL